MQLCKASCGPIIYSYSCFCSIKDPFTDRRLWNNNREFASDMSRLTHGLHMYRNTNHKTANWQKNFSSVTFPNSGRKSTVGMRWMRSYNKVCCQGKARAREQLCNVWQLSSHHWTIRDTCPSVRTPFTKFCWCCRISWGFILFVKSSSSAQGLAPLAPGP